MHSPEAIVRTLNYKSLGTLGFWYGKGGESTGINWSTIIFIAGMTVMVEGMGHAGFFNWLCLKIAKLVHYKTTSLLICFMLMSGVLSMFIDSITVIMFLAAVSIELAKTLKFDPVPLVPEPKGSETLIIKCPYNCRFRLFCLKFSVRTSVARRRCAEILQT